MLCSFQRPEPWQPVHQWTMPQVPSPDQCEDEQAVYARAIQNSKSNPKVIRILQERLAVSNTICSLVSLEKGSLHFF